MAMISIFEPDLDVRQLFARMVERLGHEVVDGTMPADALIVDVDTPLGRERASDGHWAGVAVVCVSVYPPCPEWRGAVPGPFLVKPFRQAELGEALSVVTDSSPAPARERAGRMPAVAD